MATRLYTIPETAALLGVCRDTVYKLIAEGDLDATEAAPRSSKSPKTRVSDEAIAAFIAARTRTAKELRAV